MMLARDTMTRALCTVHVRIVAAVRSRDGRSSASLTLQATSTITEMPALIATEISGRPAIIEIVMRLRWCGSQPVRIGAFLQMNRLIENLA